MPHATRFVNDTSESFVSLDLSFGLCDKLLSSGQDMSMSYSIYTAYGKVPTSRDSPLPSLSVEVSLHINPAYLWFVVSSHKDKYTH